MHRFLQMVGAFCLTAVLATAAPTLWVNDDDGGLGTVDVATGNTTFFGNFGMAFTDIAFDPDGNLYAVNFWNLYRLNTSTTTATLVGSIGAVSGAFNSLVFGSDGTLYGASNQLYKIDTATGLASSVGEIGYDSAGDLAFLNGNLYLTTSTNQLVQVDTATGAGTLVGSLGVGSVFGLAAPGDGMLYAVAGTRIYTVDPLTGTATAKSNYGGQGLLAANGAAFFTESSGVPEPSTVVLLGAGLAALAARRKFSGKVL